MGPTDAARKALVTDISIECEERGSLGYPRDFLMNGSLPDSLWVVYLTIQEGLLPPISYREFFETEAGAREFCANHAIGSDFSRPLEPALLKNVSFDSLVDANFLPLTNARTEAFSVFETLRTSGLTGIDGQNTSILVLDFLGDTRIRTLQERYGENWQAAACFEYCFYQLPHHSPAYIAAAHNFCYYITGDDFKAGYLLRDLEVLLANVETDALRGIKTRKSAKAGGQARARDIGPETQKRLELMQGYLVTGHSIANAARLTSERHGLGTASANRKLWTRHHGKK